jgi:hypothetical protein
MVFDKDSNTAFFDHHGESSQISSATEIIYRTMTELGVLDRTPELDRLVNFVTLVDNKKYPAEEFLRSAKTILGLQREVKFNQLLAYFKEHDSPFDELTLVELDKYGL